MCNLEGRQLCRTGLSVSALGLGAMDLGGQPAAKEIFDGEANRVLNADSGITFTDTAVCYGTTAARIGRLISEQCRLPVTRRNARLGVILAGMLFAVGAFAQTPGDAPPKPDAEPMAPIADPTIPAAKPKRNYDRFYFQTSLLTSHFRHDTKHDDRNHLLDAEYRFDKEWLGGRWIAGASAFDNSFGQPSQYVYGGWMYPIPRHESFYLTLSAGVLHGYKPPYQDKVPYNQNGYAPAIIPAAGYCYRKVCSEIIFFGAGVMVTLGLAIH